VNLGGVGVALRAQYAGGDDTVDGAPHAGDIFDSKPEVGDEIRNRVDIVANRHQLVQPGMNNLHEVTSGESREVWRGAAPSRLADTVSVRPTATERGEAARIISSERSDRAQRGNERARRDIRTAR
jgi:hypothetical protein